MQIVFRCYNCETLNEIPADYQHRLCMNCGKIITYQPGESILCSDLSEVCDQFLKVRALSQKLAEDFFRQADLDISRISEIITNHKNKEIEFLDIPTATIAETVLLIIKNNINSLDELLHNCSMFDISSQKLEKILVQMRKEGLIYQPKGWMIYLI